jgi:hypothetical protein
MPVLLAKFTTDAFAAPAMPIAARIAISLECLMTFSSFTAMHGALRRDSAAQSGRP